MSEILQTQQGQARAEVGTGRTLNNNLKPLPETFHESRNQKAADLGMRH
jgi:hypothetical protein